jgi:hypothetical protein
MNCALEFTKPWLGCSEFCVFYPGNISPAKRICGPISTQKATLTSKIVEVTVLYEVNIV